METYKQDYTANKNGANPFFSGFQNIEDLYKTDLPFLLPYLNRIFWVDATLSYLNYGCGAAQSAISKLFKQNELPISQLGVSKRVRASKKKLYTQMLKPTSDLYKVRDLYEALFRNKYFVDKLILYYEFGMLNKISEFYGNNASPQITSALDHLNKLSKAETYSDFMKITRGDKDRIESLINTLGFYNFMTVIRSHNSFLSHIRNSNSYSSHQFKSFDGRRDLKKKPVAKRVVNRFVSLW